MYRAMLLLVAVTFVPSAAAAQQPCTTDARHVVNELYRHMLERQADAGSAHWVQQLESGRMTVRDVVRSIANSPEYRQRFHYTEPGESVPYERSVARLYRHMLGRQPDAAGQRAHAQAAQQSGPEAVVDRIIYSNEYDQQFGDWGVPGSGGVRYCGANNQGAALPQVAPANRGRAMGRVNRFENMDGNRNGVIEPREWNGTLAAFNRLDVDGNNVLSRDEFLNASPNNLPVGTSGSFVRVNARDRWTDTGIDVRQGQTVFLDSQGSVRLSYDPNDVADPAGSHSGRRMNNAPVRNQSAGALIGRIGSSSVPLFIGDRQSFRAPSSGRLYLGVNDADLRDNEGDFQVTISVQ